MAKTLNGITCAGWRDIGGDAVEFSLQGTTVADAAALDGQTLEVKDGEKLIASYAGFEVTGVSIATDGESVRLRAARALEPQTEQAIKALETNLTALTGKVETVEQAAETATSTGADTMQAVGELGTMIDTLQQSNADIMQAIGELGTLITTMSADGTDTQE